MCLVQPRGIPVYSPSYLLGPPTTPVLSGNMVGNTREGSGAPPSIIIITLQLYYCVYQGLIVRENMLIQGDTMASVMDPVLYWISVT